MTLQDYKGVIGSHVDMQKSDSLHTSSMQHCRMTTAYKYKQENGPIYFPQTPQTWNVTITIV